SLGRRGLRVAAADTIATAPAFSSRWCADRFVAPHQGDDPDADPDASVAFVEKLLETHRVRVVIPAADGTIEALRRARARLRPHVGLALANEAALELAVNKEKTFAVARELGLHVPRSVILHGVDELPAALNDIGLPAVVKPVQSWAESSQGNQRVVSELVVSKEEAAVAVERLTEVGATVAFQQLLLGRRESVSFMYAHDTIYARFATWALRMEPPLGGTSVLWRLIEPPADIAAQAERLIRAIGLDGFCQVEFRRGDDGRPYLMEINPRLTADIGLAVSAGIDVPYMLYQWASGDKIDPMKPYRPGGWMRYLGGDIRATFDLVTRPNRPGQPRPVRAVADFCVSCVRPMRYDYLDRRDLAPALKASQGFIGHTIAKYVFGKATY
ncbi:MAG TPA: ATP-grasp domain-containing protein, partial [Ktedonobacterales bacterium]|nr:ATP-grasp domain-containing protein [Ktedonobacterales bacterium]